MLRSVLLGSVCLVAVPVWADQITLTAPVTAATVFPQGAQVTRSVTLTLPPGRHQVTLTGLPADTDPATLRVTGTGATIGAVALQSGRALPGPRPDDPAVAAARAEVRRLEAALRGRDAAVAEIRARAQAADDTIGFLRDLARADGAQAANLAALADTVTDRMLAARRAAIQAETEAKAAETGREDDQRALDDARARLEALETPEADRTALVLEIETTAPEARLDLSSATGGASWSPVYDLRLDSAAGTVTLDRGVSIAQSTGEDWPEAALTLSTARPAGQAGASTVEPWFPQVVEAAPADAAMRQMAAAPIAAPAPEAAYDAVPAALETARIGGTVVYRYPAKVAVRSGVDALRLTLDSRAIKADLAAQAVPLYDQTAFLTAHLVNDTGEIVLPGPATLIADGAIVGQAPLELLAPGQDVRLGFGPIDGLRLRRDLPTQAEGERGLLRGRNTRDETAVLRIENLTGRDWPVRLVDRVPVSTQDDLTVEWSADPAPDQTDPEGARGVLVWNRTVPKGAVEEVTLTTRLSWPSGKVLAP